MKLPAACPSLGGGSTYATTSLAVRCWGRRCSVILPQVLELVEASGDLDEGSVFEENYPTLLAAALTDDLGLCPRCRRGLCRPRPKPEIFVEVSAALDEFTQAAAQAAESVDRFMAVDRRGRQ